MDKDECCTSRSFQKYREFPLFLYKCSAWSLENDRLLALLFANRRKTGKNKRRNEKNTRGSSTDVNVIEMHHLSSRRRPVHYFLFIFWFFLNFVPVPGWAKCNKHVIKRENEEHGCEILIFINFSESRGALEENDVYNLFWSNLTSFRRQTTVPKSSPYVGGRK